MRKVITLGLAVVYAPGVFAQGAWDRVDLPAENDTYSVEAGVERGAGKAWWEALEDSTLTALIEEGLTANGDIRAAWQNVIRWQGGSEQLRAALLPRVSLDAQRSLSPTDSLGFGFGFSGFGGFDADSYWSGSQGLSGQWGVDLFTTNLQSWRAGRFDVQAAEGDRDAAALGLVTRIAAAYYDARSARAQLAIVEQQAQNNRILLEIARARYEGGDARGLDVLQQEARLAASEARLPSAELQVTLSNYQLAVLVGRTPGEDLPDLDPELPDLRPAPGAGIPAELVLARPDLRAASARVDAARLRRLSATLAVLPSLGVSGSYGTQVIEIDEADEIDIWTLGLTASVPVFNGGASLGRIKEARAGERAAADQLDQLVLISIAEVEGTLARERSASAVIDAQRIQLEASRLAFEEARHRYEGGLADYQQLLSALDGYQNAQLSMLSAKRERIDARVSLHEALGGQWTRNFPNPETKR